MSHDLRRRLAYFGPREKLYSSDNTEVHGLPRNWRRVLGMSYPSAVVGPFGCVYADIEHALCAYRYMYTSNRPIYGQMFRAEVNKFAGSSMCRRWGSANGMSLLLTDPNDRIWILIRDRCMFDLVYQRISRDKVYRDILSTLVDAQYLPVYHVRTANAMTYWGATMNREAVTNTMNDRSPQEDLETLYKEAAKQSYKSPKELLIGDNRMGEIMVEAIEAYRHLQKGMVTTRVQGLFQGSLRAELTPLGKHVISQAERELDDDENHLMENGRPGNSGKKSGKKPKTYQKKAAAEEDGVDVEGCLPPPLLQQKQQFHVQDPATNIAPLEYSQEGDGNDSLDVLDMMLNTTMDEHTANEILRIAGIDTDTDEDDEKLAAQQDHKLYSLF